MQTHGMMADEILYELSANLEELPEVLARVRSRVPHLKREVAEYQGALLYSLVKPYNLPGTTILEIGTAWGYSAALMAEAAPLAKIITLNPKSTEATVARQNLLAYPNVTVVERISWDYLNEYRGPNLDVIFVDGDHNRIWLDMPWWDRLNEGGVMLFHDYSPEESARPCPPVFDCLNEWAEQQQRAFDILVVDDVNVGFAGFYKTPELDPAPEPEKVARKRRG